MQNYSNQELAHMNHDQLSALVHQLPAPLEWNQSWTDKQKLGKKNVDELYNARKNYFHHHVQINTNVYTDADDVSYHSIKEY